MFKKKLFVLFIGSFLSLNATILEDKIINIIDQEQVDKYRNLVDDVLNTKNIILADKSINYQVLLKSIKEQGLLNTALNQQTDINITFNILNGNKKGFKIIKEILSDIGYTYYFTDFIKSEKNHLTWKIHFKSDFVLDPYIFNNELIRYDSKIVNITKNSPINWDYQIDFQEGILSHVQTIPLNEEIQLPMPFDPYILVLPNAKDLLIASTKANNWIPKISFYDKNLNPLGTIEMDRVYEGIKVTIPKNTKYVKISDRFTLLNLKRGLSILASNNL